MGGGAARYREIRSDGEFSCKITDMTIVSADKISSFQGHIVRCGMDATLVEKIIDCAPLSAFDQAAFNQPMAWTCARNRLAYGQPFNRLENSYFAVELAPTRQGQRDCLCSYGYACGSNRHLR